MSKPKPDRYTVLGETIARSILDCGSEGSAYRIALKGGNSRKETDLGGLCEAALASHIRGVLIDEDVFGEFKHLSGGRWPATPKPPKRP